MSTTTHAGRPIVAGYEWRSRVVVNAATPAFPVGVAITSDVRTAVSEPRLIATLSTSNGGITRIDDSTIELVLSGGVTYSLTPGKVFLDFVRTDTGVPQYLGFILGVPVRTPVTKSSVL